MIEVLLASTLSYSPAKEEKINQQCSYIVGIPYASDNFTDEEWKRFQLCKKLVR